MIAPARAAAFQALRSVSAAEARHAEARTDSTERRRADLGNALSRVRNRLADARDRALVTELVLGTLRWRGAIDYQLERISGRRLDRVDPAVLDALRLASYQLLYLQRVPSSASVNDAVAMVKSAGFTRASGFANAVLRTLSRERESLVWPDRPASAATPEGERALIRYLSTVHSHPSWLIERWVTRYGAEHAEQWLVFNNVPPAITLATNRLKGDREQLAASLAAESVITTPTRAAPYGLTVQEGRPLASHAFLSGACFVQDEASQLIPELVGARAGERVLDACAAPGGKTVALAAQVGHAGRGVVATDVRPRRMRTLADTLNRCGVSGARLVQIGSRDPLPFGVDVFDRILIDAPCSGLGTVRRDPDIRWNRSHEDLPRLATMQVDLLHRIAPVLRPGGMLVYSTCSSEPEENEDVVAQFLAAASAFEVVPLSTLAHIPDAMKALATAEGFLRTDPGRDGLEAFFAAILVKRAERDWPQT